jgi:hypothetical protein
MTKGNLLSIQQDMHFYFYFINFLFIYARTNFPEKDNNQILHCSPTLGLTKTDWTPIACVLQKRLVLMNV